MDGIKEIVSANITEAYKDALQPSIRVLGRATAQCVSLFASPVGKTAEILEKNLTRYIARLEQYKEEDLVVPSTRILVPVLEKMRYIDDELVSNYYAQILATASIKSESSKVSIAFIEILNRLCADELIFLKYLKYQKRIHVVNLKRSVGNIGHENLIRNMHVLPEGLTHSNYRNPETYNVYFANMIGLGLIIKPSNMVMAENTVYDKIENAETLKVYIENLGDQEIKIEFDRGLIEITELGTALVCFAPI